MRKAERASVYYGVKRTYPYGALCLALEKRNISFQDLHCVKLGVDSGRGSLKVCASLVEKKKFYGEQMKNKNRRKFSDALSVSSTFCSTGLMRTLILAMFPPIPESYDIIKNIIEEAGLRRIRFEYGKRFVPSSDLKVLLVVLGVTVDKIWHFSVRLLK